MRKNATKLAALALSLALTVTSVNVPASAASVKLNKTKATLYVSGVSKLKTTTLKVKNTNKKVTFTSTNAKVATVNSKGKVTAKKAGSATIKAKVTGGKTYKCKVTVKSKYIPVTGITASVGGKSTGITLGLGKTDNIKVTTKPTKPTVKGATFKTSNKNIVAINQLGKIRGKGLGKATITVTSKAVNKNNNHKKATLAVEVKEVVDDTNNPNATDSPTDTKKVTGVSLDRSTQTIMVGGTAALTATVSPENAANKKVTWTSDNAGVATVDQNGEVKGVSAGTANIIATTDDGGFTASCAVTVIAETNTNAAKAEISLTNPYSEKHNDTVLVGTNANIRVRILDKDGEPVGNAPVVLTEKRLDGSGAQINKTDAVLTTDKDGYVTFVYGDYAEDWHGSWDHDNISAMCDERIGSYRLTATVAGSNVSADTTVKFGAIVLGTDNDDTGDTVVDIMNNVDDNDDIKNLEPGTNAVGTDGLYTTKDRNKKDVEYASAQQVSSGDRDHSVTFSTCAYLKLPGDEVSDTADDIYKEVNFDSGEYSLYDEKSWDAVVDETKAANLQYATVNFSELSLSKYAKVELKAYLVDKTTEKEAAEQAAGLEPFDTDTIKGSDEKVGAWAWQIQLKDIDAGNKYLYVTAKLTSKGQVNTERNTGFKVKDIVGVYKKTLATDGGSSEKLDDVKVEWAIDSNVSMTIPKTISSSDSGVEGRIATILNAKSLVSDPTKTYGSLGYTYKYVLPAFPHTGNAIITIYDKNGSVVSYFAVPTKNNGNNENVIASEIDLNEELYEISEEEAKNSVGEIKSSTDSQVVVYSEKTGFTHLVGTVTTTNKDLVLDAANSKVYSSVQWNPIPNVAVSTASVGVAFLGQKATITAQLIDVNRNEVNVPGVGINFYAGDGTELEPGVSPESERKKKDNKAHVNVISISNGGKTNSKGQVELVLSSEEVDTLNNITATTTKDYSVEFVLGKETTNSSSVDLCWLDANVAFTADANEVDGKDGNGYANLTRTSEEKQKNDTPDGQINPTVGTKWEYGIEILAQGKKEVVKNYFILPASFQNKPWINNDVDAVIDGVNTIVSMNDGSKGTATIGTNKVNITSTEAGGSKALFKLNKTSFGNDDISVTFKTGSGSENVAYVGSGEVSIERELTLNIGWGVSGLSGTFVLPTSRYVPMGDDKVAYFKVVDQYGNVVPNEKVILNVTGTYFNVSTSSAVSPVTSASIKDAESDDNGIVAFKLVGLDEENDTATVTATIDNSAETFSQAFTWRKATGPNLTSAEYKDKTLVLTFSDELCPDSKNVKARDVKFIKDNRTSASAASFITYKVTDIAVDGNKLILSLPASFNESINEECAFEIVLDSDEKDSITYYIASETTGKYRDPVVVTIEANGGAGKFLPGTPGSIVADINGAASAADTAADFYGKLGVRGITDENVGIYNQILQITTGSSIGDIAYTPISTGASIDAGDLEVTRDVEKLISLIQKDVDIYAPYIPVALLQEKDLMKSDLTVSSASILTDEFVKQIKDLKKLRDEIAANSYVEDLSLLTNFGNITSGAIDILKGVTTTSLEALDTNLDKLIDKNFNYLGKVAVVADLVKVATDAKDVDAAVQKYREDLADDVLTLFETYLNNTTDTKATAKEKAEVVSALIEAVKDSDKRTGYTIRFNAAVAKLDS